MPHTRRHFLKNSLLSSATLAVAGRRTATAVPPSSPRRRERVLVVGAGIAGLVAASELRAKGLEVIVVDARDRVGGRVWTVEAGDVPADLGAMWLEDSPGNRALEFCRLRGLKTVGANEDSLRVFDADGKEFPPAEVDSWYDEATRLLERTKQLNRSRIKQGLPDVTMAQALQSLLGDVPLGDRRARFRDWALSVEAEAPRAENLSRLALRRYWGDDEHSAARCPRVRLAGGFQQVAQLMARDLDVRLSRRVRVVRVDAKGAAIETDREVFQADRALVTLPLGVLKSGRVQFLPTLPDTKLKAIAALGFGAAQRTVLQFPQPFINLGAEHLGYASTEGGRLVEWTSLRGPKAAVLSVWSHGDAARALERGGRSLAVAEARATLRRMFGGAPAAPASSVVSNWNADPFSAGVFSCLPVGASLDHFDLLAAPVGNRLFFAGEATSRERAGSVHGAWLSGLREAQRIAGAVAQA